MWSVCSAKQEDIIKLIWFQTVAVIKPSNVHHLSYNNNNNNNKSKKINAPNHASKTQPHTECRDESKCTRAKKF